MIQKIRAFKYARVLIVLLIIGVVGTASAISSLAVKKPAPVKHHTVHKTVSKPMPVASSSAVPALTLPSVVTPTPTVSTPATPNNTAQCNSILNAGEADLNSLNTQITQQLAIMKQIIGNSSADTQIDGSGTQGMIDQSQTTESFNQANDEVNTLTNQLSSDRENYVNQLIGLGCWTQEGTMTSYDPAS